MTFKDFATNRIVIAVVSAILGYLAALAQATPTKADDIAVQGLQDSFNEWVDENVKTVTLPVTETSPTVAK